jgi:hypothetical protein
MNSATVTPAAADSVAFQCTMCGHEKAPFHHAVFMVVMLLSRAQRACCWSSKPTRRSAPTGWSSKPTRRSAPTDWSSNPTPPQRAHRLVEQADPPQRAHRLVEQPDPAAARPAIGRTSRLGP